jgi:hypothetical protein
MSEEKKFNPAEHLMDLKGKTAYLPVAARVVWFRERYPAESGWSIQTFLDDGGFEKGHAVYRCEIRDPEGRLVATGHNVEDRKGFGDFMQKAETGAVGRALALLGFGTMAALDEGEVVDSPVEKGKRITFEIKGKATDSFRDAPPVPPSGDGPVMDLCCSWQGCGQVVTPMQAKATQAQFKRTICREHIKDAAAEKIAGKPLN